MSHDSDKTKRIFKIAQWCSQKNTLCFAYEYVINLKSLLAILHVIVSNEYCNMSDSQACGTQEIF